MGNETLRWLLLVLGWCVRDLREAASTLADGGIAPELSAELVRKTEELTALRGQVAEMDARTGATSIPEERSKR